jgi:hypothetical protein
MSGNPVDAIRKSRRSFAWRLIAPLMLTASPVLAQGMVGGGGIGPGGNGPQAGPGNAGPDRPGGRREAGNPLRRTGGNADLMAWLAGIGMPDHEEIDEPVTGFANEALWEEERAPVKLARR